MIRRSDPDRSGHRPAMALLFVLMVLILTVTSVASLAKISISTRVSQDLQTDTRLCDDLQRAAHIAILQWLQRDSRRVSLPPEATEPRVAVLDDAWTSLDGERNQRIRITAWDQTGMVPLAHLRKSSPLASTLPSNFPKDAQPLIDAESPGLDQLETELVRFPESVQHARAIGAFIATHNGRSSRRGRQDHGSINVNTAPIELVEAAMRMAGRDGIDQVVEARSAGRTANPPGGSRTRDPIAPRLTSQSNAWSFRVDLQSNSVRQSWWCVYRNDGSRWSLAQRLMVND